VQRVQDPGREASSGDDASDQARVLEQREPEAAAIPVGNPDESGDDDDDVDQVDGLNKVRDRALAGAEAGRVKTR